MNYLYILFILFININLSLASEISLDEISKSLNNETAEIEDSQTAEIEDSQTAEIEDSQTAEDNKTHTTNKDDAISFLKKKVTIIILNKITAKSELIEFKIDAEQYFGNLSVEVKRCIKNTDPVKPSSLVLINVFDNRPDDDRVSVFSGWLDSSNPSISTVEHPVYEIIPKECSD